MQVQVLYTLAFEGEASIPILAEYSLEYYPKECEFSTTKEDVLVSIVKMDTEQRTKSKGEILRYGGEKPEFAQVFKWENKFVKGAIEPCHVDIQSVLL